MSALFLGQGFSVAAAMCHHGSAHEHAIARASRDGAVAAEARAEETAASVVEKKGALTGALSLHSTIADLAPVANLAAQSAIGSALPWPVAGASTLEGQATTPLLRPPLA